MKGIIRRTRSGLLLLAAGLAVSACETTHLGSSCSTKCKPAKGTIFGAKHCAPPCGDVVVKATPIHTVGHVSDGHVSGGHGGRLKEKLADFDWEQLRSDHCWPEQYNFEARRRVNDPLRDQMIAGALMEATVWDWHFVDRADKGPDQRGDSRAELSDAGKIRLRYLARKRPYVIAGLSLQSSYDNALNEKRRQAVLAAMRKYSLQPVDWTVTVIDAEPTGLFGIEGIYSINKMRGVGTGEPIAIPRYETILKNTFYQGTGGGAAPGGGGGGGGGS